MQIGRSQAVTVEEEGIWIQKEVVSLSGRRRGQAVFPMEEVMIMELAFFQLFYYV